MHCVVRVVAAALAAGASPIVSTAIALPQPITVALAALEVEAHQEDADAWTARLRDLAAQEGPSASARVRLVAGTSREAETAAVHAATGGKPDIAVHAGPVVSAGRIEMLPHLREQAVSITAHRFGTPHELSSGIL